MATTLIFIRHGESEGNLHHIFLGQQNMPLTPLGKRQAALTAEFLRDTPINAVYASDLTRAMMTAEPVARQKGLAIQPETGLREIFAGAWEMKTYEEIAEMFPEDYQCWREDIGRVRCTEGESTAELQQRVKDPLESIVRRHAGQTVCVVTHATALRSIKCAWYGLPVERMNEVPWPRNASVTTVRYEDDGSVTMLLDDEVSQLGNEVTVVSKSIP